MESGLRRRDLLIRAGVLGAGATVAGVWPAAAGAQTPSLDDLAGPALDLLTHDTFAGLAVFAVPGPDRYSRAQRLTSPTPGGVQARGPEFLRHTLDHYLPFPDAYVHTLAAAFATGVSEVPLPSSLLGGLLGRLEHHAATLDEALRAALANDESVPASLVAALLLNVAATQVNPRAVIGPIPASPFANLSHREKGLAFDRLERADPDIVALVDAALPEPLNESASGLVRFVSGVKLALTPFGAYSEFGVFDRAALRATTRPVGWDLSRYMPGRTTPADGWPELLGYYQGRRAVQTAPEYGGA